MEFGYIHAFTLKQLKLFVDASCVSGQTSVASYDAVTGNDDGNRIMSYGTTDSLCRHIFLELLGGKSGKTAIGDDGSVRNAAEFAPDVPTKCAACRCQWQFGRERTSSGKVAIQPVASLLQKGVMRSIQRWLCECALKIFLSVDPESGNVLVGADDGKAADRREIVQKKVHESPRKRDSFSVP